MGGPSEWLARTPREMPQCVPGKRGVGLQPPGPWAAPPEAWAAGHLLSSVLQVPRLSWHLLQLGSHVLQGPRVN